MNFRVESGELSADFVEDNAKNAALEALKFWHAASERIHLGSILIVKKIGPRGGIQEEKMFSTNCILEELDLKFIITDLESIVANEE